MSLSNYVTIAHEDQLWGKKPFDQDDKVHETLKATWLIPLFPPLPFHLFFATLLPTWLYV